MTYLVAAGLRVKVCGTVAAVRQTLGRERFALAILDVLLPDGNGIKWLMSHCV